MKKIFNYTFNSDGVGDEISDWIKRLVKNKELINTASIVVEIIEDEDI